MRATLMGFIGGQVGRDSASLQEEMTEGEVRCEFRLDDGMEVICSAHVKQTVGSKFEDLIVEVGPVEGLPPSAEYDHNNFAEKARRYY